MTVTVKYKIKLWTVSKCFAAMQCVHFACSNCMLHVITIVYDIHRRSSRGWAVAAAINTFTFHPSSTADCRSSTLPNSAEACSRMLQLPAAAHHGDKVPLNIFPWSVLPSPSSSKAKEVSSEDQTRVLLGFCQETSLHSLLANHQLPNI